MSKYLLEIGTEELPYKFIPQAIEQLKAGFENFFRNNKIGFSSIKVLATPRRLALIVDDFADKQSDEEKIVKGPIKNVAYDENGNLTKAGLGFGNKCGVDESGLFLKDDYLHARIFSKGKFTAELLQENVSQIILKLQGPHFMRWAGFDEKFSRPIRWIVSILDDKEIPVQIIDVKSSKFTRGHRFSEQNVVEINNVDEYVEKLRKAYVIVNQDERKALIVKSADNEADKLGAKAHYNEDLLDEVTYLCEYPVPVVCDFDKKYLDIPQKVTVTVMSSHQRYFALFKDGKLINKFITITNYLGNDFSNIKAGNERVIVARLDDAIFFFKEDTKKPFAEYVEDLKGVTFQKGMGTIYDKTQRIVDLSDFIATRLNAPPETIKRAALLCKADLTTSLVFEFTELQGFIGADYAKLSGEDAKVVKGINEHYFPLSSDSELAEGIEGQVVGIADKLDTICAVFVDGKKPTGSSDPLGVRRAALGIIKTLIDKGLKLDLIELINLAESKLPKRSENKKEFLAQIEDFFVQRTIIFLADSYRKDILEACAKNKSPLENLCDFVERVKLLSNLIESPDFTSMVESANRVSRILKENVETTVNPNLFAIEEEKNLFEKIKEIEEESYEKLFEGLEKANPSIEKFFEKVLVMDKNEDIKANRLAMLGMLKRKYDLIANFGALQI
ncbi:MAG: glycine--tRNA ligase subunit beta [bacterium]